ncbi:MAG: AAA family ATPase [Bacilli bacterium]|nr:AAA family ATPase [Bacilli bacterium]
MIYLKNFKLLNEDYEDGMIMNKMNIHTNFYPLRIFPEKEFEKIDFEPITIFYGGNGSGKTTILNIISDTVNASKRNIDKRTIFFDQYVQCCKQHCELIHQGECKSIKYISSDDVFDYLLDLRAINSSVNRRKTELISEYFEYKYNPSEKYNSSLSQYEDLRNKVDSNRMTASKYVRTRLRNNTIMQESNGETALDFWQNEIEDNSLYIIDEPENSLSAENQLKLKTFIEESARFYNCQFIIATHSPFLLALDGAKIYDLDSKPVKPKKWTELDNVKVYNSFFEEHRDEFN